MKTFCSEFLESIKQDCKDHRNNCKDCKWFSGDPLFECLFFELPEWWNVQEIMKRYYNMKKDGDQNET